MTSHDDRPDAVRAAEAGTEQWRAAVLAQRTARPEHADFHALAGELVVTLRALSSLAGVLGVQVADYGEGRVLRDDASADPAARLAEAVQLLAAVRRDLDRAERAANNLWSAVSHIATGDDPDPEEEGQ
jgi:hypothetical protein